MPQRRPAADEAAATRALTGGLVLLADGFAPATVVLAGGAILAAGPAVAVPDAAEVVDCSGLAVLPGFVDCHVHLRFASPSAVLAGGVTTVRDLGSPPKPAPPSPLRIVTAGRILTSVGGYPTRSWGADGTGREVRDVADAVVAVGEQVRAGAAVVKVALEPRSGPVLDEAIVAGIVAAAAGAGLAVTAHVGGPAELELALRAGVSELAHLPLYDVTEAEMRRAAGAGVVLVPTLQIRGPDPAAGRAVRAFREAGGTVVYGTDLGNEGTAPGIAGGEVRALLAAGMTLEEVLAAATGAAADHLGLDGVGRVAAGWAADLVAVDETLAGGDVAALDDVRLAVAAGRTVRERR